VVTVSSGLTSKLTAMIFAGLASKPVATVFSNLASKLVATVSLSLASKSAVGFFVEPHHGDHFPYRSGFSTGGSFTHSEPRDMDGSCFPRRGSRPTRPSGEVQRTVKTSSDRMVKCWIYKIYLTNPSIEPSTFSRPM
jgi:hypothetical protein